MKRLCYGIAALLSAVAIAAAQSGAELERQLQELKQQYAETTLLGRSNDRPISRRPGVAADQGRECAGALSDRRGRVGNRVDDHQRARGHVDDPDCRVL